MTPEEFTETAVQVAAELGALRGENWTIAEGDRWPHSCRLTAGIAVLRLHGPSGDGKLGVAGMGPYGSQLLRWTINVSVSRGAAAVAKDINRRILGAGYLDDMLYARAKKAAADKRFAEQLAWLGKAAALFDLDREAEHTPGDPKDRLYLGKFVTGQGYVEAGSRGPGQLSINLSGIPSQVALDMLAVLAKHVAADTQCCQLYGPGHPPQFSVVGCLRQKSERGEAASADRVARLVAAHGALPGSPQAALDEARNGGHQVSVVMDGIGATAAALAVVRWDHEGCGEYTVELSRPPAQLSYDESEALFDAWRERPEGKNWADWLGARSVRIHPAWR